jgi:hypothetical protein
MRVHIVREPDDPIAETRISIGNPRETPRDFYIVFRGEPEKVVALLEYSLEVAKVALPAEMYKDDRGQG